MHRPHEDTRVRKLVARQASDVNKLGVKLPKNALYHKVPGLPVLAMQGAMQGSMHAVGGSAVLWLYGLTCCWCS